jgi:hypothetical protein
MKAVIEWSIRVVSVGFEPRILPTVWLFDRLFRETQSDEGKRHYCFWARAGQRTSQKIFLDR